MRSKYIAVAVTILFSSLFSSGAEAAGEENNWQYWRGPRMNGISEESDWEAGFLDRPLRVNWQINVGNGYSNVAIYGDHLYTMGFDKGSGSNNLYCLELATGKEVWKYSYKASPEKYLGPRSTPVIDEGIVYTLGQDGDFVANDALTGEIIWKRNVADEFDAAMPRWMFASSALIEGDMAVVNAGRSGVALNKKTGEVIWQSEKGTANYSTPVPYSVGQVKYLAVFGKEDLYGVESASGDVVWSFPWQTSWDVNAADPGIFGESIFISSGYGKGCALIDVSGDEPVELWRNDNLSAHFSSPIIIDGFVYGVSGNAGTDGTLTCLDLEDGSVRWSAEIGFGNMTSANGYIIFINERGGLYVVSADPSEYKEISRKEGVLGRLCWTAPVLCRSTLYLRNSNGDLVSIDVSKQD